MSTNENNIWLDAVQKAFEEALEDGQWDLAAAMIEDTKDQGFDKEAQDMRQRLTHEQFIDR